jgi:hypothetical protein
MNKINFTLLCFLLLTFACAQKVEKPKITISDYTTQSLVSKGVVEKIIHETDYKKMHEMASAIENSRAISCVSVSEECNLLGKILNKIINASQHGLPKDIDNIEIYKMINELDKELKIGHDKLATQWAEYIKANK